MAWTDEDEARCIYKLMKCDALEPEDLTRKEYMLLRQYYPKVHAFVTAFLESRQKMIEDGEWTMQHEPIDRQGRMNRYEQGRGLVKPWSGRKTGGDESESAEADD